MFLGGQWNFIQIFCVEETMNDPKLNIKQFKQQQGYFAINHTNHYVLADNYVTEHNNAKEVSVTSVQSNN